MRKRLKSLFFFWLIAGCVEPYEFVVRDEAPSLVVEAYISDKSYRETLLYPSDGRYFTVKLSETSDVTNTRTNPVREAKVTLVSGDGEEWTYESRGNGIYSLMNIDFKALPGKAYKLEIRLQDEQVYESSWETLPEIGAQGIGEIDFRETKKQRYVMESGKWKLRTLDYVTVMIQLPGRPTREPIYYRWTYSPMWVYMAPLVPPSDAVAKCWATDPLYLNGYGLQIDRTGGYQKELFEFPTVRNERIYEKFSVLVTQHAMNEPFHNFWKEMQEQTDAGALTDKPPFNLRTNLTCITSQKKVSGYFGVTSEEATRWYFDRSALSYQVTNTLLTDCLVVYGPGPPAEECLDCRAYSFGRATTVRPAWWQQ